MTKEGIIGSEKGNYDDDVLNIKGKRIIVETDSDVKTDKKQSNYETRVSAERKRRRKEMQLYNDLRHLLPQLPLKVHKATILKEAKSSIETLNQTLKSLKRQKLEKLHNAYTDTNVSSAHSLLVANNEEPFSDKGTAYMMSLNTTCNSSQTLNIFKTWTSSNVTLSVCGSDGAVINICSLKNPHLFSKLCFILDKHNLKVVFAQISSDHAKTLYMIRVHDTVIPAGYATGFPYEERCKRAMVEIMHLVMDNHHKLF